MKSRKQKNLNKLELIGQERIFEKQIQKEKSLLRKQEFEMTYSSLYEGLKRNEKSSLCFNIQFIIRRQLLCIVLVFCQFNTMFQISFSIVMSFLTIAYLLRFKPLENKYENILMIFNEYMTMISAYILVSLALISQSGNVIGENI